MAQFARQFQRDGFVVVPNLLGDDELERFGRAVDRAVTERKRFDTRALTEKSLYEQSFIQCMNLWEDNPEVLPLTFHPGIARTAAELLGVKALRLWHDQALYKEAGGRVTDPHQDHPYWPILETDGITAWIPFDGSPVESGCMGYLAGSHRIGLRKYVNIFKGDQSEAFKDNPELAGIEPVYVAVPRGGVAFHHGLTVHMAKANRSGRVRRVHTMIYFRDGCTRGSEARHPSVDRPGIKVGEVIASDLTPIAWPRGAGDLPKPPELPHDPNLRAFAKVGVFPLNAKYGKEG